MSTKLHSLLKHNKIPVEKVREILKSRDKRYHSIIPDALHHPQLTHEDFSALRARQDLRHIDYDLSEVPHLPQETQLEIIHDPESDESTKLNTAYYMSDVNDNPHSDVIEKAASYLSRASSPAHTLLKTVLKHRNATHRALSNLVGGMMNKIHLFNHSDFEKVFNHPNISKHTIQYVHDNSTGEIKNLAKKYL